MSQSRNLYLVKLLSRCQDGVESSAIVVKFRKFYENDLIEEQS
jgi:hypothetical protein